MSELKPCPFCGREVTVDKWGDVHCDNNNQYIDEGEYCPNDIILKPKEWNTRPIEDDLTAELARRDEQTTQHLEWMAEQGNTITELRAEIDRLKQDCEVRLTATNQMQHMIQDGIKARLLEANDMIARRDEIITRLKEALPTLKMGHSYCEDSWYSCPKAEDGCSNDAEGEDCNCGTDEHNAIIDALMKELAEC